MLFVETLLIVAAVAGNAALWFAVFNILHSYALPHRFLRVASPATYTAVLLVPCGFAFWYVRGGGPLGDMLAAGRLTPATCYLAACYVAIVVVPVWRLARTVTN